MPSRGQFLSTIILTAVALVTLVRGGAGAVPLYSLTALGSRYVTALNDTGQLVGTGRVDASSQGPPFVYQNGTFTDLSDIQNGKLTDPSNLITRFIPQGLNDQGQVVGFSNGGFGYQHGKMMSLGSLGGGGTEPEAINNAGQIVGFSSRSLNNPADTAHAFLYQNGKMVDLGTLGGPRSYTWAINNASQVVGTSDYLPGTANPYSHAFLYQNRSMFDLNKLVSNGTG
jgi:probable HAF family extracellular repeat protein